MLLRGTVGFLQTDRQTDRQTDLPPPTAVDRSAQSLLVLVLDCDLSATSWIGEKRLWSALNILNPHDSCGHAERWGSTLLGMGKVTGMLFP